MFWFSDELWSRIDPLPPSKPRGAQMTGACYRGSSIRLRATGICPPDCSSMRSWSRRAAPPAAQKGSFGQSYRPYPHGRQSKIYALCDEQGRPSTLAVSPGKTRMSPSRCSASALLRRLPNWSPEGRSQARRRGYNANVLPLRGLAPRRPP